MSIEDQIKSSVRRLRKVGVNPENLKFNNNTYNLLKREVLHTMVVVFIDKGEEKPLAPQYMGLKIRIDNALLDGEVEVY